MSRLASIGWLKSRNEERFGRCMREGGVRPYTLISAAALEGWRRWKRLHEVAIEKVVETSFGGRHGKCIHRGPLKRPFKAEA